MRFSDLLQVQLGAEGASIRSLDPQGLQKLMWDHYHAIAQSEGLAAGRSPEELVAWVRTKVEEACRRAGEVGEEMRRLLDDEQTLEDLESLGLLVGFCFACIPALRDSPLPALYALVIFELQRRAKQKGSH